MTFYAPGSAKKGQ